MNVDHYWQSCQLYNTDGQECAHSWNFPTAMEIRSDQSKHIKRNKKQTYLRHFLHYVTSSKGDNMYLQNHNVHTHTDNFSPWKCLGDGFESRCSKKKNFFLSTLTLLIPVHIKTETLLNCFLTLSWDLSSCKISSFTLSSRSIFSSSRSIFSSSNMAKSRYKKQQKGGGNSAGSTKTCSQLMWSCHVTHTSTIKTWLLLQIVIITWHVVSVYFVVPKYVLNVLHKCHK